MLVGVTLRDHQRARVAANWHEQEAAAKGRTLDLPDPLNGLADRQKFYDTACRVLRVTIVPGTRAALPPPPPLFPRGFEAIEAAGPTRAPRKAKPRPAKKRKVKRAAGPKKRASAARGPSRKKIANGPRRRKR